jgi:hypothetical protein
VTAGTHSTDDQGKTTCKDKLGLTRTNGTQRGSVSPGKWLLSTTLAHDDHSDEEGEWEQALPHVLDTLPLGARGDTCTDAGLARPQHTVTRLRPGSG